MDPEDTPAPSPFLPVVSGPAYGRSYKLLLGACIALLTAWGLRLALQPDTWQLQTSLLIWGLAGYAAVVYMAIILLRSTTTVGPDTLQQSWFWRKEVPLAQISHARLLRWPGMEWLVAPRLYVRAGPGPWIGYHGATPALWQAFETLARTRTGL